MKQLALSLILLSVFTHCYSQKKDPSAAILKNIQQIPVFNIHIAPDSIAFTNDQLQKDKPFVLIFFNPDCDHCQKETKELLAYKEELKEIQIVMVSALPYKMIKDFYAEYNIVSMPNIKMGQDATYALGTKYKPGKFPAIFVYDTSGTLAKVFAGNAGAPAIIEATK
ncbi:MAG: thioredoxin fold domain-containing protein [Bacteroidota bacterium]